MAYNKRRISAHMENIARLVLIPKPGKCKVEIGAYRALYMLHNLSKLFE